MALMERYAFPQEVSCGKAALLPDTQPGKFNFT